MAGNAASSEVTEFSHSISPIGVFFVVVPSAVIVGCLMALIFFRLPIALMALLVLLMGCCGMLVKEAAMDMLEVKIEWSAQGLTVHRLIGGADYSWTDIEKIELHDAGATFGDFGRHEEHRAGIGLYIRDPARKERQHGAPPDVIIVSRCGEAADRIPKLVERLSNTKRSSGGGRDARKIGAAAPMLGAKSAKGGKPAKSGKAFRRNGAAAA